MRTMFVMGFRPADGFFGMGQVGQPKQLSQSRRDELMIAIDGALANMDYVKSVIADISRKDPSLKSGLGEYTARYLDLSSYAASIYPKIQDLYGRLMSDDSADWMATEDDEAYARDWTVSVDTMRQIVETAYKAPTVPGTVTRKAPPAPESKVLGIPTSDLLVGSAVTVGLGVILYAIFG